MPKENKSQKILVISDMHCGHNSGLTPPSWQYKVNPNPPTDLIKKRNKFAVLQKEMWDWYADTIKKLGKIDSLFVLGDVVDGPESKSGGTELITVDIEEQAEMAVECIQQTKADNIIMVYGTPYHSGIVIDTENIIADKVKAKKIGGHEWVDVNGLVFDLKHKTGGSSIPYGRQTSIAKSKLWGDIWHDKQMQPKSNIILRGHNHFDGYVGGADWLAVNVPCLQWNTKFGVRQCESYVSIGMVIFNVDKNGDYSWKFEMAKLEHQKVQALKL